MSNFPPPQGLSGATGNATPADVLNGATFSTSKGEGQTGTMPNNGNPTLNPGDTIAAGYYGGGSVAAPVAGSKTWSTHGAYSWTVPTGVTRILAQTWGAGGGASLSYTGGQGAYASAFLSVTPGQTLTVNVGAGGASGTSPTRGANTDIVNGSTSLLDVEGGSAATASATGSGGTVVTSTVFTSQSGSAGTSSQLSAPGSSSGLAYGGAGAAKAEVYTTNAGQYGTSTGYSYGQPITPVSDISVQGITIPGSYLANPLTTLEIYSDSGSLLYSANPDSNGSIKFSSPMTLSGGQTYWLSMQAGGASGSGPGPYINHSSSTSITVEGVTVTLSSMYYSPSGGFPKNGTVNNNYMIYLGLIPAPTQGTDGAVRIQW